MDDKIIAVYCWCDDLLIALNPHDEKQCHMSDAQVGARHASPLLQRELRNRTTIVTGTGLYPYHVRKESLPASIESNRCF